MSSSARAAVASAKTAANTTPFGSWREADGKFGIEFARTVMEEIRAAGARWAFGIGRGGIETGGFLFGTRLGNFVRVLGWLEIPSRHAFGPSFRLDQADHEVLELMKDQRNGRQDLLELQLVGWFVAHTRRDLTLTPAEAELADRAFPDPDALTLVLRPVSYGGMEGRWYRRTGDPARLTACEPLMDVDPVPRRLPDATRHTSVEPASARESNVPPRPSMTVPQAQRAASGVWVAVCLGLLLAAGLGGSAWMVWRSWQAMNVRPAPLQLISLATSRVGDRLDLHWNARSDLLKPGMTALIEVDEAERSLLFRLSPEQTALGKTVVDGAGDAGLVIMTLLDGERVVFQENTEWSKPAVKTE